MAEVDLHLAKCRRVPKTETLKRFKIIMKKLFLFLFSWLFMAHMGRSQEVFEKNYGGGSARLNLIELMSRNIFAGIAPHSGVSLLDANGTVLHTGTYQVDTLLVFQAVKKYTDNEFYFVAGYIKDTCSMNTIALRNIYPAIGKMDSLGNISYVRHYVMNAGCQNVPRELETMSDKAVMTWGTFFALKADSVGAHIWSKHFGGIGGVQFIKELPSGDLLMGMNMDTAGAVVARMDAAGEMIWCRSYIRPKGMVHDCVIESDSSFLITGYTDSLSRWTIPPPPFVLNQKLFLLKLDGSGDVQWCKGYASERNWNHIGASRIEHTLDGNFVVLANIRTVQGDRPYLIKIDHNGDTLWARSSGVSGRRYDVNDLLVSADGGFLYSGVDNNAAVYIHKTDSLGHPPCNEQWYSVEVQDLFPTDSSFTLSSIDGAVMRPAFVRDTIHDPMLCYDACTITAVQVPGPYPSKFRLRPNPTTGQFTMEFQDPLVAKSYYSVFDPMGRLLFQRPLPTGATLEEVDLSRFGKGTYVIKVTDQNSVRVERVVLE